MEFPDYCEVKTIGKPDKNVVLLHGYTLNRDSPSLLSYENDLKKIGNIRLIRCDQYGHGSRSKREWDKLNIPKMVDELIDLASKIKREDKDSEVHIVGVSMGGIVGIDALIKRPELFDSVIACASPVSYDIGADLVKNVVTTDPLSQKEAIEKLESNKFGRDIFPMDLLELNYDSSCPSKDVKDKIYVYSNTYDASSKNYDEFAEKLCYTDEEKKEHIKVADYGLRFSPPLNHIYVCTFDRGAKNFAHEIIERK